MSSLGQERFIQPSKGWVSLGLADIREIWAARELIYFLVWRDIKVRYKQTILGASWSVLQPLFLMIVFSVIFGEVARLPSEGIPYPLFTYGTLAVWTLFANSMSSVSASLLGNAGLLTKAYFPRLVLPIVSVISALFDFSIAFVLVPILMVYYRVALSAHALLLPVIISIAVMVATGLGLWLAPLNVQFRDVNFSIPLILRLWFYATPVVYSASVLPGFLVPLVSMNPVTPLMNGIRWSLLGAGPPPANDLVLIATLGVVLIITGAFFFKRMERTFADVI